MRILHVAAPGEIGGLERVVQMLAIAQHAAGESVHVAAVLHGSSEQLRARFFSPLRAADVMAHEVCVPARGYIRERAAIAALCRVHRPDIVHLHGYRCDVVDAAAARAAGAATVTTVHGFTGGGLRNRAYEWLQRRAIRKCDAVVAVARSLMRNLLSAGTPADRIHLVVNAWRPTAIPLDPPVARHLLGAGDTEFAIGWVGRISKEKGLDVALRSLRELAGIPARLHVIGDGREKCRLRALAEALGVGDRVVWHGAIQNAERLYRGFDAFVLSSRTEGTPIVLFEAMSARVPIVATCVGGVPGMVTEREALLVPPNDPDALGAAIREVYEAPSAALRRSNSAHRRLAAEYREGTWVDRYRIVYDAAVAAAAVRS